MNMEESKTDSTVGNSPNKRMLPTMELLSIKRPRASPSLETEPSNTSVCLASPEAVLVERSNEVSQIQQHYHHDPHHEEQHDANEMGSTRSASVAIAINLPITPSDDDDYDNIHNDRPPPHDRVRDYQHNRRHNRNERNDFSPQHITTASHRISVLPAAYSEMKVKTQQPPATATRIQNNCIVTDRGETIMTTTTTTTTPCNNVGFATQHKLEDPASASMMANIKEEVEESNQHLRGSNRNSVSQPAIPSIEAKPELLILQRYGQLANRAMMTRCTLLLGMLMVLATTACWWTATTTTTSMQPAPPNQHNHRQGWLPRLSMQSMTKTIARSTTVHDHGIEEKAAVQPRTLRNFLLDKRGFHLAMAPAFFGFYGYFGSLAAWQDQLLSSTTTSPLTKDDRQDTTIEQQNDQITMHRIVNATLGHRLLSVAGASAGAMAAILLAAGIPPRVAADFCTTITLSDFADFPGWGALFRGNRFEAIIATFLQQHSAMIVKANSNNNNTVLQSHHVPLQMEDAVVPVAVTAFDLQTMQGQVLTYGNMARAARASATFPGLFQPVGWKWPITTTTRTRRNGKRGTNSSTTTANNINRMEQPAVAVDYTLVDGGITDPAGLIGLTSFLKRQHQQQQLHQTSPTIGGNIFRIVNLKVENYGMVAPTVVDPALLAILATTTSQKSDNNHNNHNNVTAVVELVSIVLRNLPPCGPWAMSMGHVAVQAAYDAMVASLDTPLHRIILDNDMVQPNQQQQSQQQQLNNGIPHIVLYERIIDASSFWKGRSHSK